MEKIITHFKNKLDFIFSSHVLEDFDNIIVYDNLDKETISKLEKKVIELV